MYRNKIHRTIRPLTRTRSKKSLQPRKPPRAPRHSRRPNLNAHLPQRRHLTYPIPRRIIRIHRAAPGRALPIWLVVRHYMADIPPVAYQVLDGGEKGGRG